jgi:hypothetical protein
MNHSPFHRTTAKTVFTSAITVENNRSVGHYPSSRKYFNIELFPDLSLISLNIKISANGRSKVVLTFNTLTITAFMVIFDFHLIIVRFTSIGF